MHYYRPGRGVALGIIEQGFSLAEIFHPIRLESQVNISHPICEKCHGLFRGYRLAFQKDGVTGNVSNGGVVPWSADCPAN